MVKLQLITGTAALLYPVGSAEFMAPEEVNSFVGVTHWVILLMIGNVLNIVLHLVLQALFKSSNSKLKLSLGYHC